MDKIDLDEFEEATCYKWLCKMCHTTNIEVTNKEDLEAVFCPECGNTFEVTK